MADHEDYLPGEAPTAHKTTHQTGGTDEVSIAALLGTPAALAAHALLPTIHQDAPALIGAHALLAGIHHLRYTDLEAKAAADVQIAIHADLPTVHQDAPDLIADHQGDVSAHHSKYTDANARAAVVEDEAYGAAWDADTIHAASKNALYDEIQLLKASISTPISWNMLTAAPRVIGQGTWVRTTSATYPYHGIFYNTSNANGDNFTCIFRCPAGTYTLRFSASKEPNAGIVDVYIDDSEEGSIDLYAASANYIYVIDMDLLSISAGAHTLKFQLHGKHASSSGYRLHITAICLTRTA